MSVQAQHALHHEAVLLGMGAVALGYIGGFLLGGLACSAVMLHQSHLVLRFVRKLGDLAGGVVSIYSGQVRRHLVKCSAANQGAMSGGVRAPKEKNLALFPKP